MMRMIKIKDIIKEDPIFRELEKFSKEYFEGSEFMPTPTEADIQFYTLRQKSFTYSSAMYLPHSFFQYEEVLQAVCKNDVVIDAGAGDFRLAYLMSKIVKKVYALEVNPELVKGALEIIGFNLPKNLIMICSDWTDFPIPADVNFIVCLCNAPVVPDYWKGHKIMLGQGVDEKISIHVIK
jgi:protein-L-isoaspartate O-methyltransferase